GFCTGRPPVQPSGPVGRPAHNSATVRNRASLAVRLPPLGRGLRTTPLGRPQVSLAFVQGDLRSSPVGRSGDRPTTRPPSGTGRPWQCVFADSTHPTGFGKQRTEVITWIVGWPSTTTAARSDRRRRKQDGSLAREKSHPAPRPYAPPGL